MEYKNTGIQTGIAFSAFLLLIHAIVDWLNSGYSQADGVLWFFQVFIYFIASLTAANAQFRASQDSDKEVEHMGIVEAGRGAAMITCLAMWAYIVVRSVVLDDAGMFGGSGILPFCGFILLDFIVAIALGNWGGRIIINQHAPVNNY